MTKKSRRNSTVGLRVCLEIIDMTHNVQQFRTQKCMNLLKRFLEDTIVGVLIYWRGGVNERNKTNQSN